MAMAWKAEPVLGTLIVLCLAGMVYTIKDAAREDQLRLDAMRREAVAAEERIKVLTAEITFLESPDRLRRLASDRLGLAPIDPWRVVKLEEAPLLLETGKSPSPVAVGLHR